VLTTRGRIALASGLLLYFAAWAVGSAALYPVAVGLVLASGLAWASVRFAAAPTELRRSAAGVQHVEGDDVAVELEAVPSGRLAPWALTVVDRVARLGAFEVVLRRSGRRLRGRYVVPSVPRGRYVHEGSLASVDDPFGLARAELELPPGAALLVYPRLAELDRLFTEAGAHAHGGRRRLLLRRPSGFDLHSVREHQQGESLRRVHWPTTARRGMLMVKELEDEPRDEIAVVLDAAADPVAGTPPDSSFELQVRAAGSILLAHARHGRRALLVVNDGAGGAHGLRGDEGDWRRALDVLAAVEPTAVMPVTALLAEEDGAAARARELTVVTARLGGALVDRLGERGLAGRPAALVYVDSASWSGVSRPVPELLRLQALGVPVAVLRRGDDLAAKLGPPLVEAAGG
jgi:uncharacterized protein (DUF58 family)